MKTSFGWINVKKVSHSRPRRWKYTCSCGATQSTFKMQKTAERGAAKHVSLAHTAVSTAA